MEKILGTSFIRVHKSSIVNIAFIHSLVSRQNGDYDLIMKDGCTVRASRNYVAALKKKLSSG
jgi:DNA-binding LytR/AlgR family response regulator